MTRGEFATIMAYIAGGIGKALSQDALEVYFDLLGDLPFKALDAAARKVLLEHKWASFPSVAELRQAASETQRGEVCELSAAEAWRLAWAAVGRIDLESEGSLQRATKNLAPIVLECMQTLGIAAMIGGREPVGVIRGQFLRVFEQLSARDRRKALLPASLKNEIAAIGWATMPPAIAGRVGVADILKAV